MSAVTAINKALDAVITAAGISYHAGNVPPTVQPPFVVSSDDNENSRAYYANRANETLVNLHIWALHKMAALALFDELVELLDDGDIDIQGFELERGRLRLVTSFTDPVTGLHHAIAEYRALTAVAA